MYDLKVKKLEIVEIMQGHKISSMRLLDCRRKGSGMKEVDTNVILVWSGLEVKQRANTWSGLSHQ